MKRLRNLIAVAALLAAMVTAAPAHAVPTYGMAGLTGNAWQLTQYITANYPGVRSIGGVRPDRLPDHPSGRAIDIMLDDLALGDAILADVRAQAGRFGVKYTLWRVPAHFDHIHVTVY